MSDSHLPSASFSPDPDILGKWAQFPLQMNCTAHLLEMSIIKVFTEDQSYIYSSANSWAKKKKNPGNFQINLFPKSVSLEWISIDFCHSVCQCLNSSVYHLWIAGQNSCVQHTFIYSISLQHVWYLLHYWGHRVLLHHRNHRVEARNTTGLFYDGFFVYSIFVPAILQISRSADTG